MARIDMTDDGSKDLLTGVHLWEVFGAYEKKSAKGDDMFVVTLTCGSAKLQDNIMLSGPAWPRIGRPKLAALGVPIDMAGELDPLDLIGRRVWVATVVEQKPYEDKQTGQMRDGVPRLVADIKQLASAGYQHESNVPEGGEVPEDVSGLTPF